MRKDLSQFGVEQAVFTRALEDLAKGFCVISEDFKVKELTDEDLVSIGPAGRVHLQIHTDVFYWAAIAEDTWFAKEETARAIADRIRDPIQHHNPSTVLYNAEATVEMMVEERQKEMDSYRAVFVDKRFELMTETMDRAFRSVNA